MSEWLSELTKARIKRDVHYRTAPHVKCDVADCGCNCVSCLDERAARIQKNLKGLSR